MGVVQQAVGKIKREGDGHKWKIDEWPVVVGGWLAGWLVHQGTINVIVLFSVICQMLTPIQNKNNVFL